MATQQKPEMVLSSLEKEGYRARIVSIRHVKDLQAQIEGLNRQNLFSPEFYKEFLEEFNYTVNEGFSETGSIIVVAAPQPQVRFQFEWGGKTSAFLVPPTYLEGSQKVLEVLESLLVPRGYRVVRASLPVKTLAVCSGLGAYGRNNICYVDGLGSFIRLSAFYSDYPCPEDHWQEPALMESCKNCTVCYQKCPTGAITPDRVLIQAEKCITLHDERPNNVPFPDWLDPALLKCVVGCMLCQKSCPQNKKVANWISDGESFSEEETRLLLEGIPKEQLPASMVEKLDRSNFKYLLEVIPRNLAALLNPAVQANQDVTASP